MPLADTAIRNARPLDKSYKLSDAQGLYLLIKPNGSRLWHLKYRFGGKEKKLAFGAYPTVTLANARKLREEACPVLSAGDDPGVKKQQEKHSRKSGNTFEELARKWVASNIRWTETHAAKALRSLELHVFPPSGKFPITDLKTADLLIPRRVAERKGNQETAARIQQCTTAIMRYAVQEGLIASNPANDLAGAIAPPPKNHYPSLPLGKLPEMLERIEGYSGRLLTRLAVQLNLMIFIRSSEIRFARWTEIDLDGAMWTIPAQREPIPGVRYSERGAKMKTPHLVPLSTQAVTVLKQLKLLSGNGELLFPGDHDPRKPMPMPMPMPMPNSNGGRILEPASSEKEMRTMRKMNRMGCAICLAVLLAATTPDVGAATYQEILRLNEAYPPGSVMVCRSDLPGDGKMRLPTTQTTRGKVITRRGNLTDFDAVVTWLPKGENGKELTLTFRATERTERAGQYTRIDTDSIAVSQVGASPEEEKIILDGFRSHIDGTEKFAPYANVEITVLPSFIVRNQGEPPAYCHKERYKNE